MAGSAEHLPVRSAAPPQKNCANAIAFSQTGFTMTAALEARPGVFRRGGMNGNREQFLF